MIYGSKIDGILKCYSVKVIALTYSTNKSATYTYDAEGNKLRVVT